MLRVFYFWRSVLIEAFAKTKADVIGKTRVELLREVAFLGLACAAARWLLQSQDIANQSLVWSLSIVLACGFLFIVILAWNLVSIPATRERRLTDQIAQDVALADLLSPHEWAILLDCSPIDPTKDQVLNYYSPGCNLNGKPFKFSDDQYYPFEITVAQIERLKHHGLADVIRATRVDVMFRLTTKAASLAKNRQSGD